MMWSFTKKLRHCWNFPENLQKVSVKLTYKTLYRLLYVFDIKSNLNMKLKNQMLTIF